MRRPSAGMTEVGDRRHQRAAKMLAPDAIHLDAGGQRILWRRDPLSERQPATCRLRSAGDLDVSVRSDKYLRHAGRYIRPRPMVIAANENVGLRSVAVHVDQ